MEVAQTTSLTNFSYSLFRELGASQEGNLFASTYSIQLLLVLLAVGARNNTKNDLLSVLRTSDEKFQKKLQKSTHNHIDDPKFLNIANGIFVDKAFKLNEDFVDKAHNNMGSEVKNVDFVGDLSAAESKINKWTSNHTHGKIPKLFDTGTITPDTKLVLASAVHFKNEWEKEFKESKMERFCLTAQKHIQVDMMHQTDYFQYYKDEQNKFAAIELPYTGGDFQMLVVLPDVMDGITALEKSFLGDSTNFLALLDKMTTHKVILTLPKFKFESNLNLKSAMSNLGCGDMFTSNSDFSGISSSGAGNLKVNDIKHRSLVNVDELGTEAAAVTGVTMVNYMANIPPKNTKTVTFKACHPFLFFIKKDRKIIFMGRLTNPINN